MAFDERLAARVREAMPDGLAVQERRMFGGLAFLIGGHMGCGIVGERLMVRIPPDEYEATLARPHVEPMDFTGKPMRGFVFVGPEGIASAPALADWVGRGVAFASGLPPKS